MLFGIRSRSFVLLLAIFLILTTIAISQVTFESEKQFMESVQSASGNYVIDLGVWLITESGNVFVLYHLVLFYLSYDEQEGLV